MTHKPSLNMRNQWIFPLIVGIFAMFLVIMGDFVKVASPAQETDEIVISAIYNSIDNYTYRAWIQRYTETDSLLVHNAFTTDEHLSGYFNPYFWLLARLSTAFNLSPDFFYKLSGILSLPIISICIYMTALNIGFSDRASKLATIITLFASGLSGLVFLMSYLLGKPFFVSGSDVLYLDSIVYTASHTLPYHTVSYALLSIIIFAITSIEKVDTKTRTLAFSHLALWGILLLLTLIHPYEGFIVSGVYGLYVFLETLQTREINHLKWMTTITMLVAIMPVGMYSIWLSSDPVWSNFAQQSLFLPYLRVSWIIGYGLTGILMLYGGWIAFKDERFRQARWLALWAYFLLILLIIINIPVSKIIAGGFLPLALLAGLGLDYFIQANTGNKILQAINMLIVIVLLFNSNFFPFLSNIKTPTFSRDLEEIVTHIQVRDTDSRILSDKQVGIFLPAFYDVDVWLAHWALTPGYDDKQNQTLLAGILENPEIEHSLENFEDLILTSNTNWLIVRESQAGNDYAQQSIYTENEFCGDTYCLYIINHESASE